VTQAAFTFLNVALGIFAAGVVILRRDAKVLRRALMHGALYTLTAIVGVVFAAVVAWDFFFTLFHQLFFSEGTWIFLYSDTLIRLYPEQFWFDAALLIGILTIGSALVLFAGTVWLGRGVARRHEAV
jgi:integral membrane protein (TIGR01906 family)